jgi:hypothetical protein
MNHSVIDRLDQLIITIKSIRMTRHVCASTSDTLEAFVADWHAGRIPRAEWTHGAHVAVCAYYAFAHDPETTFAIVKVGILAFARSCGIVHTATSGYHETLTRFWALTIAAHVRSCGAADRWEAARAALERFGDDRDLPQRAYSFDVVRDVRARAEWVAPDRAVDGLPAVA